MKSKAKIKRELLKKKSAYCKYAHQCDKDFDCKAGEFCAAFKHTDSFTSLRFGRDK